MPLIRIDAPETTTAQHREAIVEVIYDALINVQQTGGKSITAKATKTG